MTVKFMIDAVLTGKILVFLGLFFLVVIWFCLFFDHAVLTRQGTIYRVPAAIPKIALTFDDGPSPVWTPLILDELQKHRAKATFFVIGHHVKSYPEVARRIVREGHVIANHGYAHSVILYYTPAEIEEEIKYTEQVIKETTGQLTRFYRPPKAWLISPLQKKIKSLGYDVILWSLNSKDWTPFFDAQGWVHQVSQKIKPGDIILLHDSGNIFSAEGGDRSQTCEAVSHLVPALRKRGFEFVTVEELLKTQGTSGALGASRPQDTGHKSQVVAI